MQGERMKKQYRLYLLAIIVIIYVSVLIIVAFKYLDTNRYWEIDGFDTNITAESGQDVNVKARVKNKMYNVLGSKDNYFISYHLCNETGSPIQYENLRTNIEDIEPGMTENIEVHIKAPTEKGRYKIKIDIVQEGKYWFEGRGENPGVLYLNVN